MALAEQIQKDLIRAMKAKDPARVGVLRMISAALKNKQIEKKAALSNEEVLQVLKTQQKQRGESIDQFEKGGRPELAEKERQEKLVIESYLPEPVLGRRRGKRDCGRDSGSRRRRTEEHGSGHERVDEPLASHWQNSGWQDGELSGQDQASGARRERDGGVEIATPRPRPRARSGVDIRGLANQHRQTPLSTSDP